MTNANESPTYQYQATRRGVALVFLPAGSVVALVPAWAVMCGALAAASELTAGGKQWGSLFALDPHSLTALILAVFIVQVLWSTWQATLVAAVSSRDSTRSYPLGQATRVLGVPYATPWSPLGRLAHRWRALLRSGSVGLTRVLVIPLLLILSAVAGWQMLVLSLASTALSLIEWRFARHGRTSSALQAGTQVGLGWMSGHTVVASLSWTSLILACCYAIAYQGALLLDQELPSSQRAVDHKGVAPLASAQSGQAWPLALFFGGQGAAIGLLFLLERPLAATFAGGLLAPQWLLLPLLPPLTPENRPHPGHSSSDYTRKAIRFAMVAMLIAGWAVNA